MISNKPINWFKALLSVAILVSIGLAWWAAAVQEASRAPRVISKKDRTKLLSMLTDYAPQRPKIAVYYSNDQESQQYARQWEQVLRDAGWDLIEERKDFPDHQFLAEWYGTEIHVKGNGEKVVFGAPARLGKAIQQIGIDVRVIRDEKIAHDEIRLDLGTKEN